MLLVDDDPGVLRIYGSVLKNAGFTVVTAIDGALAIATLAEHRFDAVVSDISMPELGGLALLRLVRESADEDVPVILMTGDPAVESAIQAVEFGAHRYLVKPVNPNEMVAAVDRAVNLRRLAQSNRRAKELLGPQIEEAVENASLHEAFGSGLALLRLEFQPIISWSGKRVVGYEALLRTDAPGLSRPDDFLQAAEGLGRLRDLGREIRKVFSMMAGAAPPGADLYLNLHAHDFDDDELFSADAPLSALAHRVVLELTERAPLDDIKALRRRVDRLREIGFRLALDDLGAGYAGLATFASLEPDVVKIDLGLVRDVDSDSTKGMVLTSLIGLCRGLGMEVIAEGIETPGERDALVAMGCDLLQGFLFARPGQAFPAARF